MTNRLSWRCVWITGASTGIGRDVAIKLAREGVQVAISARSADTLQSTADLHSNLHAFPLDVSDRDAVMQVENDVRSKLGPIDLAIFNAGVWKPMKAVEFDSRLSKTSMDVNYTGVANGIDAVLPDMLARTAGHIALVASVAGYRGLPLSGAYAPTKAALINLSEVLYLELQPKGIDITIVNPGFVDTPMTSVNKFPMPFIVSPEEAADRIISGLKRKKFEIAFPWRLVFWLKLGRVMRLRTYFWYARTFLFSESKDG